eukprot:13410443-Alexandrium_andersonii.AAC.1
MPESCPTAQHAGPPRLRLPEFHRGRHCHPASLHPCTPHAALSRVAAAERGCPSRRTRLGLWLMHKAPHKLG